MSHISLRVQDFDPLDPDAFRPVAEMGKEILRLVGGPSGWRIPLPGALGDLPATVLLIVLACTWLALRAMRLVRRLRPRNEREAAMPTGEALQELRAYEDMRRRGIITDADFNAAQERILRRLRN